MNDDFRAPVGGRGDKPQSAAADNNKDSLQNTEAELQAKIDQLGQGEATHAAEPDETIDEAKLEEEFGPPPIDDSPVSNTADQPTKAGFFSRQFWTRRHRLSRTQAIVGGICVALILAALGFWAWGLNQGGPLQSIGKSPQPKTVQSKLTGLQVDPEVNERQVTGVMIENTKFARPQSGLAKAGVVYEALAEAGITRFMALYQDSTADALGPVRSARPYYVQWCSAFDCALAHVGGSPEALSDLKKWKVKNIDQFFGAQYYHRINARYAPHNMYTSGKNLIKYEKSRGYDKSDYTGFQHRLRAPRVQAAAVTTKSINFNYPHGSLYDVHYDFDAKTNSYLRSEGGQPHYSYDGDAKGKKTRLSPKVVIALVIPHGLEKDNYHSTYESIGHGRLYLFQDGTVTTGQWSRAARDQQFSLTDSQGKPLQLNPGQTWISVVGASADVSYK